MNTSDNKLKWIKKRCAFNLEKDIFLLKSSLLHNPWQTDDKNWKKVLDELLRAFDDFPPTLTTRTVRDRVNLLCKQLLTEQLVARNGTNEEIVERERLLQQIIPIMEGMEFPVNIKMGSEAGSTGTHIEDIDGLDLGRSSSNVDEDSLAGLERLQQKKDRLNFKEITDSNQNWSYVSAPSPMVSGIPDSSQGPPKRPKLSGDEDIERLRLHHQFQVDMRKITMEEQNQKNKFELESQELEIQKSKVELEIQKEARLLEEGKRRDEIATSQLQVQNNIYQLMLKMLEIHKQN